MRELLHIRGTFQDVILSSFREYLPIELVDTRIITQSAACFSSESLDTGNLLPQSCLTLLVVMEFEQVVTCHFLKQRNKKPHTVRQEVRATSQQTSGHMAVLSSKCVDAIMCFSSPCASVMLKEPPHHHRWD